MIEIRQTTIYCGPNTWARVPVIRLLVDIGELEDRPSHRIPGFTDRLIELLPSLENHVCSRGHRGGFIERLREGTWMGHILEHIALDLQTLAGATVTRGLTRQANKRGLYNVVYAYKQEDVGLAAGELARRLLNHLVYTEEPNFDFQQELEERVIRLAERLSFGPSTSAIVDEAERRGIPVIRLHPRRSLVQLGHGCYQKRIWATLTSETSEVASTIAGDKQLTNQLLRDVGIPSPLGLVAESADEAAEAARRIGFPVVLKPQDGNHGRGVGINLSDEAAVRAHFPVAADQSRSGVAIVERFITGKDYRVLVVDRQVVAVAERVPAHVIGDGERSVRELVEIANADPRRGIGHEKILTRISIDGQTEEALARQGLSLDAVPEHGQWVQLKLTGNMSTGGTSIDRTDEIHPDNAEIARQAAMVVDLDVAGIDFVTPDITRSVHEVGGAIIEVNAAPGFRMHTHPTEGLPRQVGRAVLDMLFRPGEPTRVPIAAVTGTNGKTTTSRMLAAIMRASGKTVGLTTSDGIYIGGTQIASGDMAGPDSARAVLKNPRVDFAVLETARGGILRSGLGFDRCNIAIVTNVAADHLGMRGVETVEDLARVKTVVPASVFRDGASVLNADNRFTIDMAKDARGEIFFFSMREDNPIIADHLLERGRALLLRSTSSGEMLTLVESKRETPILPAHEIPATAGGRIRVNIENALAATAAAIAADVPLEHIREALRSFTSDFAQTPGRFNLIEVEGKQVVMDYCHNPHGLRGIADFVQRTAAPRSIGVVAMAGDRRDIDYQEFGVLAGRTFDQLIVREHSDLRGRAPGDVAERIRAAALTAGMAESRITVVLNELDAIHTAIDMAMPGDLVVALVYDIEAAWESICNRVELALEASAAD